MNGMHGLGRTLVRPGTPLRLVAFVPALIVIDFPPTVTSNGERKDFGAHMSMKE